METINSDGQIISVTDYDGNEYSVVQIGSQCWLAENLRCTHSPSTGTFIVNNQYVSGSQTSYTYTGKMARWYNNNSATYEPKHYGLLYNWNAAVDVYNSTYGELSINTDNNNAVDITFSGNRQGICPIGWHIPSTSEWDAMTTTVGVSVNDYEGEGAGKLSAGNDWFASAESSAPGNYYYSDRNISGFSAVPAGRFRASFMYQGDYTYFWSASQTGATNSYYRILYSYVNVMGYFNEDKSNGFSVRCLRD